jgi:hypothetical protein
MSHLIPAFQRNAAGRIIHRYFDSAEWPADGWFDSPSKVPGTLPGQAVGEDLPPQTFEPLTGPKPLGAIGTVYGERTQAQKAHEQALEAPRKNNGKFARGKRR